MTARVYVRTVAVHGYRLCRTGDDLMACQLPMPQHDETGDADLDDTFDLWPPQGLDTYLARVAAEFWFDRRHDTYGITRRAGR